ncbi:hypothetical protein EB118_09020 [bacterium]|nr:hypothetical protein [bacterium]NDD84033.1 hypothetical protein [bacterium]NDG30202.1 hypothetical protein [bacterium]
MSVLSIICPTVGCYQNYNCDPDFQNKIIAVAYVKKSAAITPLQKSNAQDWMDALMQSYLDGDAYLVFNTSGDKPKPDTATTTGRGMQNTKTLAKTHTLNYMDQQGVTLTNVEFYNNFLNTSQLYDFYYFTPGRIWDASGAYVTVIGDPVITNELNTYMMAEVVVTWISKVNPLPYTFNTDTFLEGLYFIIEGPSQSVPQTIFTCVPTVDANVDTGWTAVLNYEEPLVEGTLVWSLQDGTDTVPTGLSLDPDTGFIVTPSDPAVEAGTYNLVAVVTNESGCVFGTLDVTITVEDCG